MPQLLIGRRAPGRLESPESGALGRETVDASLFLRQLCVAAKFQGPHLQLANSGLSICLRLNLP